MEGTVKFGIMGFGSFAERRLVPGFSKSEHASILAITKRDGERARDRANHFGIPHSYPRSEKQDFLAMEEMEAVFVTSSNNVHVIDTIDCLRAGKHVLLEKPMGMNAAECKAMIDVAKKEGKELMIAQCMRFNETVRHVKGIVEKGGLGALVAGKCDFFSDGKSSARSWKYDKDVAGGGAAFDLGVHVVDTMRYVTGKELKDATCLHYPRDRPSDMVDEVSVFLLDMDGEFSATCTSSFRGTRNLLLELFGERGYVRAYDWNENGTEVRVESEIDGAFSRVTVTNGDMYTAEIDAFCKCIRGECENPVPGEEGLINQRIIDLVNE